MQIENYWFLIIILPILKKWIFSCIQTKLALSFNLSIHFSVDLNKKLKRNGLFYREFSDLHVFWICMAPFYLEICVCLDIFLQWERERTENNLLKRFRNINWKKFNVTFERATACPLIFSTGCKCVGGFFCTFV